MTCRLRHKTCIGGHLTRASSRRCGLRRAIVCASKRWWRAGLERLKLAGVSDADIPESMRAVEAAVKERGPGPHPMTGPVYVGELKRAIRSRSVCSRSTSSTITAG